MAEEFEDLYTPWSRKRQKGKIPPKNEFFFQEPSEDKKVLRPATVGQVYKKHRVTDHSGDSFVSCKINDNKDSAIIISSFAHRFKIC